MLVSAPLCFAVTENVVLAGVCRHWQCATLLLCPVQTPCCAYHLVSQSATGQDFLGGMHDVQPSCTLQAMLKLPLTACACSCRAEYSAHVCWSCMHDVRRSCPLQAMLNLPLTACAYWCRAGDSARDCWSWHQHKGQPLESG